MMAEFSAQASPALTDQITLEYIQDWFNYSGLVNINTAHVQNT